ncbi:hypothetical protein [Peribacillus butanolivorans]
MANQAKGISTVRKNLTKSEMAARQEAEKLVVTNPIIAVIVFAFFIYHIPNPLNNFFIKVCQGITEKVGFIKNVHDSNIKNIIYTIISSLTVIISVISAIYVFSYREQKSVAPSASTDSQKNKWVFLVICCMIFNVVFGSLIVSKYTRLMKEHGYNKESLSVTKEIFSGDLLLLSTLLLLVSLIIKLFSHLFKNMSVDKMLEDSVKNTSKLFDKIVYANRSPIFKKLLEKRYKQFHYSLESVFQNFKFAAENNMNKEFQDNIDKFDELVIKKFNQYTERYGIGFVHTYLIHEDGNQLLEAYRSALRSNFSLISSLMKNQQYNKAQDLVNLHFKMYIREEQFVRLFQNNLAIYLDTLDTSDEKQLSIFLQGISKLPSSQTFFVHKYVVMKLINKNQLINLTNAVYDFKKRYYAHPILRDSFVVILLQNLIKSIEISNYAIAGFLVKFLVTNISGEAINRGLRKVKARPTLFTSIWEEQQEKENEDSFKGINEHPVYPIKINEETFKYCLRKAFILLYGQYSYSIRKKLWFVKKWNETGGEIKLSEEFGDADYSVDYSEYIITKTQTASSKYGLLFFEDTETMKSIYSELNVTYPDSSKSSDRPLSEVISLLINKFL